MTEIRAELQAAIATFSTGAVAIGDEIHNTDQKLLNKSIMPNGKILKEYSRNQNNINFELSDRGIK